MADKFVIESCSHPGCVHFQDRNCWLNGFPITKNMAILQTLHDSETCQVRRTLNILRTEWLLEGKVDGVDNTDTDDKRN